MTQFQRFSFVFLSPLFFEFFFVIAETWKQGRIRTLIEYHNASLELLKEEPFSNRFVPFYSFLCIFNFATLSEKQIRIFEVGKRVKISTSRNLDFLNLYYFLWISNFLLLTWQVQNISKYRRCQTFLIYSSLKCCCNQSELIQGYSKQISRRKK